MSNPAPSCVELMGVKKGPALTYSESSTSLSLSTRRFPVPRVSSACSADSLDSASAVATPDPKQPPRPPSDSERILTLPTLLTLARVLLVPAIIPAFYLSPSAATGIFVVASLTDWLDGYLARKMNSSSSFGAFLDPVADKLMVAAVLVLLCSEPLPVPWLPPWALALPAIAVICREISMSAVREWAASQGPKLHGVVAVSSLGKWKTATQLVSLILLLLGRTALPGGVIEPVLATGAALLFISTFLALFSFGLYITKIWEVVARTS